MEELLHHIKQNLIVNESLKDRMQKLLDEHNDKTFSLYKPYIITIKSREVLDYINHSKTNIKEQLKHFNEYNEILTSVSKECYHRFNPLMVYTFNDEINLVFYNTSDYPDLYNGNVTKTLTTLSSFVTKHFTKEFLTRDIDFEFTFHSRYLEFTTEYETLNYLVWRQLDCKRNNTITLYKYFEVNVVNMSLEDITQNLSHYLADNDLYYSDLKEILYGFIIKKELIYVEKDDDIITRKVFNVSNIVLNEDFKTNLHKYVYNSFL